MYNPMTICETRNQNQNQNYFLIYLCSINKIYKRFCYISDRFKGNVDVFFLQRDKNK